MNKVKKNKKRKERERKVTVSPNQGVITPRPEVTIEAFLWASLTLE